MHSIGVTDYIMQQSLLLLPPRKCNRPWNFCLFYVWATFT